MESLNDVFSRTLRTDQVALSFYRAGFSDLEHHSGLQFLARANDWRSYFIERSESIIPIFGRMTFEMMAAFWGCLWAGKTPTFLSHPSVKIGAEEFRKKLENYQKYFGTQVIVCESTDRAVFSQSEECVVILPSNIATSSHVPNENLLMPIRGESPLFLQCSSGTTGAQKVAAISERQLLNQLNSYARVLQLSQSDKIVSWLPLYHDMGLIAAFLLPLSFGVPTIYIDPFEWVSSPDIQLHLIEKERATLSWLPNFSFSLLSKSRNRFDLSSMRAFISCSEPATDKAITSFTSTHGVKRSQIAVCYALAENVFAATQTLIGEAPRILMVDTAEYQRNRVKITQESGTSLVSCGRVIPDVEVKIASQEEEHIGEVLIRGSCAIAGYYKQESFLESGWLPTGDIGFLHDGELYICGRKKDMIITNGKNIYPHEIESIVNRDARVYPGRCVVLGVPDENDSEEVLVLLETAGTLSQQNKDLLCFEIKKCIDGMFDISSQVRVVPYQWLIKTSSGKLARTANLQRYLAADKQNIHVVGDSHVRILWTADRSFVSARRNVHAHWWGVLWSKNWQDFKDHLQKVIDRLQPNDILILEGGEPECRSAIPSADNRMARTAEAISDYRAYFNWVRSVWSGKLGFMTGPPVNGTIVGPEKGDFSTGDTVSTPEIRYHYQKIFYAHMKELCHELHIDFLDMVSPWLVSEPYLNPDLMSDFCHLKQFCNQLHFEVIENTYGFLDRRPGIEVDQTIVWSGDYDQFECLYREFVVGLRGGYRHLDFSKLVSSGAIDSKKFVNIISWLEQSLNVDVDLVSIRPHFFESAQAVYSNIIQRPPSVSEI